MYVPLDDASRDSLMAEENLEFQPSVVDLLTQSLHNVRLSQWQSQVLHPQAPLLRRKGSQKSISLHSDSTLTIYCRRPFPEYSRCKNGH